MIILDDDDGRTKSDSYEGLTLRHPQRAHTRDGVLADLPDYHTSEAQHRVKAHTAPWIDRRIWRATLYALGIYVFLTLTIVVPITVIVSALLFARRLRTHVTKLWQKSRHSDTYVTDWKSTPSWDTVNINSYAGFQLSTSAKMLADSDQSCDEWDSISSDDRHATYAHFSRQIVLYI